MKVVSYMAGIPASNKNPEKPAILTNFIEGVNKVGDQGEIVTDSVLRHCDVAVLQGFVHDTNQQVPHLRLRKNVIDTQKRNGKKTVVVDSNLFLYVDKNNPLKYHRYSFDGIFPTTAQYCWDNPDPVRWQKISKNLGLKLKPWRTSGNHILVCLQRNGGWSMKGLDTWTWLEKTIEQIRRYSDRPIIVRGHPGDSKSKRVIQTGRYPRLNFSNVYYSDVDKKTLVQDLQNCWATVVYNSSPSVASIIEGVPVFVNDPIDCQAGEVSNTEISNIESPDIFAREQWIEKIAMCHWNFEELKNGDCWKHMRQYV